MDINLTHLSAKDCYKLMVGVVVPRPIALVTTVNEAGAVNAAPFSFFNCLGGDPPIVVLGLGDRPKGDDKDTSRNIRQSREFVVNIVDESMANAMNICGIDFPPDEDEMCAAGLTALPCLHVRPPRIEQSPVSLECREHTTLHIGRNRVILGEALTMHIRDDLIDIDSMNVRTDRLHAIGRMHGPYYTRTQDLFDLERVSYQLWKDRQDG